MGTSRPVDSDDALIIRFDGSQKKINGETLSAIGYIINTQGGRRLAEYSSPEETTTTSTQAEYKALLKAIKDTKKEFGTNCRLFVFGDDRSVIDVVREDKKDSAKKESTQEIVESVQELLEEFEYTTIRHEERCYNSCANRLAKRGLREYEERQNR